MATDPYLEERIAWRDELINLKKDLLREQAASASTSNGEISMAITKMKRMELESEINKVNSQIAARYTQLGGNDPLFGHVVTVSDA